MGAKRASPHEEGSPRLRLTVADKHAGSDIKRVYMTSSWKQNTNGLVVRDRCKEAVVVMGVKGTDICLRVEANAAQDANGTGFDSKWKHDVLDVGTVVACK